MAAVVAALTFLPSLNNGFVNWDDDVFLLGQTGWRGFGPAHWAWALRAAVGSVWQPLAWLSYGLDYAVWGLEPFGFHLTSLLFHAVSAALVALLAFEFAGDTEDRDTAAGALFAALVFAVHPLRVESVSWAAERRDVLSGLLTIAALRAYLRARRSAGSLRGVAVLHALALLAKASAAVLPVLLLVLDAWPLGRFADSRRRWACLKEVVVEKAPLWALSAACVAIAAVVQHRIRWPLSQHGLCGRLAQTAYGLAFYARKTLWPTGLAPLYELRPPLELSSAPFLFSILAVVVCAALAWRQRVRRPWLAAAGAFYVLALGPVLGLTQFGPQIVADRYSYVACLPLSLLAGAAMREALRRKAARIATASACVLVVGSLAVLCVRQQAVWREGQSLWTRVAAVDPASATAQLSLGTLRAGAGRIPEAAAFFDAALARDGGCVRAQDRLAALKRRGLMESGEAVGLAWEVEKRPTCRKARLNRALAAAQLGDLERAARELETIAASARSDDPVWPNLLRARALRRGVSRGRRP